MIQRAAHLSNELLTCSGVAGRGRGRGQKRWKPPLPAGPFVAISPSRQKSCHPIVGGNEGQTSRQSDMVNKWPVCPFWGVNCPGKTRGGESPADGAAPQPHLQLTFHCPRHEKLNLSLSLDRRNMSFLIHSSSFRSLKTPCSCRTGNIQSRFVPFRDLVLDTGKRREDKTVDPLDPGRRSLLVSAEAQAQCGKL